MKSLVPLSLFGSWFASPAEIAIFTLLIVTFFALFIISYFYIKRKQKIDHERIMEKKFSNYKTNLSFSTEEENLLEKMINMLQPEIYKYQLLTEKRTFHKIVEKLKIKENISQLNLDSMENKLNFPSKKMVSNFFSSEELPIGLPSIIILNDNDKLNGNIWDNNRSSFSIKIKPPVKPMRNGMTLNIYFHDNQKIFTINSTVLSLNGDLLTLSHSLIKSQKRRAFVRKKIKLPILIRHSEFNETPMHTYIIDLSEGGASVENPNFKFKRNEGIILYYHIDTEDGFYIKGEILRLSAKGRIMHVKFINRDLTIRSRIKIIVK